MKMFLNVSAKNRANFPPIRIDINSSQALDGIMDSMINVNWESENAYKLDITLFADFGNNDLYNLHQITINETDLPDFAENLEEYAISLALENVELI